MKKEVHKTVGAMLSTKDVVCLLYTDYFMSTVRDVMNSGKIANIKSKLSIPSQTNLHNLH
jgi:hypothetical protein